MRGTPEYLNSIAGAIKSGSLFVGGVLVACRAAYAEGGFKMTLHAVCTECTDLSSGNTRSLRTTIQREKKMARQ